MHKTLAFLVIAIFFLTACSKSNPSPGTSAPNSATNMGSSADDPVQKKLQELAGSGAKNCGVLKSQATADLEAAGKCAMDSSKANAAFYVEYQMPGMNVAVVGNGQGKLYSVQSQEGGAGLVSSDCPAALRIAPSGRVTCYAPGTFPMGAGAGSHTNMPMPQMGTPGTLPAGHPGVKPQPPAKP